MKKNVGKTDKIVRLSIAAILLFLIFANVVSGTMSIVILALAAILVLTSFISFCPIYYALGKNTCQTKS
jgi:hypothetical protein